jgi:hypothetical protein
MNVRITHEQGRVPVTVFYVEGQLNLGSAAHEQMACTDDRCVCSSIFELRL